MILQLEQEATVASPQLENQWSRLTRFGFRFIFCYFFLYLSPSAIGSRGVDETHVGSYHRIFFDLWQTVVPWVGANILHIKETLIESPTGSGDQLYDYVWIVCIFTVALVAALLWSVLDRKRKNYDQLNQWLRLFLRLYLAGVLMMYGANKLFPMQFAQIPVARLSDPLGHLSPQGLLWTFMGYSRQYQIFGGMGEMLGGLLLVVPSFTTLGALISAGVLSNVLLLNLCYDVPRKILTIHLMIICGILILPDVRRMIDLFLLNRPTKPQPTIPFLKDPLLNRGVLVLQYLFALLTLIAVVQFSADRAKPVVSRLEGPLRGMWMVDQFTSDNVALPPLAAESERWSRVTFEYPAFFTVQRVQGPLQLQVFKLKEGGKTMITSNMDDLSQKGTLTVEQPDPNHLTMSGQMNGHSVNAVMHRVDLSDPVDFLLTNRGFHWITPAPLWRLDGKK
jgi:uncharacterized membrane protein YphA (DoxX/SURF4 family)